MNKIFAKINSFEELTKDRILLDMEIIVIENLKVQPFKTLEITVGNDIRKITTDNEGVFNDEIVFKTLQKPYFVSIRYIETNEVIKYYLPVEEIINFNNTEIKRLENENELLVQKNKSQINEIGLLRKKINNSSNSEKEKKKKEKETKKKKENSELINKTISFFKKYSKHAFLKSGIHDYPGYATFSTIKFMEDNRIIFYQSKDIYFEVDLTNIDSTRIYKGLRGYLYNKFNEKKPVESLQLTQNACLSFEFKEWGISRGYNSDSEITSVFIYFNFNDTTILKKIKNDIDSILRVVNNY